MGTEQNRFLLHQQMAPLQRRKRWGTCLGGLPCFGTQKTGKRVVPASRIQDANSSSNAQHRPQNGVLANTSVVPSLLAPPSSPASFSNSAIPSTVQSPSCFLSSTSPERPSATMYATGPYAHEHQLVSPPVFSTYTTEPSTAPLTPPPELAHLTTPSSPDVPYARVLSSSTNLKGMEKNNFITRNDIRASYSPYTGSPASTLRSPVSRASGELQSPSFPEHDYYSRDTKYLNSDQGRLMGIEAAKAYKSQDSNFFCPETFAQFYLDNPPNSGGRLSVSKDSDVCSNGYQNRQNNKTCKQDGDEIEAYRASFGFSADEIITTPHYVEINDVMDESLTIWSSTTNGGHKVEETHVKPRGQEESSCILGDVHGAVCDDGIGSGDEGHKFWRQPPNISVQRTPGNHNLSKKDNIFSWKGSSRGSRKYHQGLSSSDAEIDYRRGRSLREHKENSEWCD